MSLKYNQVSFDNGFVAIDKDGGKIPLYYDMADFLRKARGFKTIGKYNYIFEKTHYVQIPDEMLNKIIIDLTKRQLRPAWLANFFKIIKAEAQIRREDFIQPTRVLNLSNGILNIQNKHLGVHSDAYCFRYVLPIAYDEDATCPGFMDFLDFVFQGDKELIDVTSEIFGYCLLGGDPFLHKSFVLLGDGRNGKSTWLHVLRKLLGDDNTSSVSMGLLNKPFSAVRLDGKLANITGELPTGKLDSELFKSAVGGEYITAAHKGKDEYGLHVQARFIFACNDMPRFGDATTGMWEKLYMIPFNRYIPAADRDPGIFKRLEGELPGVLNFALDGLHRLMARRKLPEVGAVSDLIKSYREESDSVYDYYKKFIVVDKKFDAYVTYNKHIHKAYKSWCEQNGQNYVGVSQLSKRLRRILKEEGHLDTVVKTVNGKHGRKYNALFIENISEKTGF